MGLFNAYVQGFVIFKYVSSFTSVRFLIFGGDNFDFGVRFLTFGG